MSQPVRMKICWRVTPEESGRITAALHTLMVAIRKDPSSVGCHLSTEMGPRTGLIYIEEWKDEEGLKRQLRSARFSKLAELLEWSIESPVVEFTLPAGTRDLGYAEEVRMDQSA